MPRNSINISLDRDLLVILLYRASVNKRSTNEEVEELLYYAVRSGAEADPDDATLAHLDELYGQIHGFWERGSKPDPIADRSPF